MRKIVFVFLMMACFSSISSAAESLVGEGTHEISGTNGMRITRASGATSFNTGVGYGYFVTDFFEPGVAMDFAFGDDFDFEVFLPTARFYYNDGQRVLPFVGLGMGVVSASTDLTGRATSFLLAPGLGILVPFNKHGGFFASFLYERTFSNGGANIFVISPFGLSLFF